MVAVPTAVRAMRLATSTVAYRAATGTQSHKFNNRHYAERDHNGHDHDHFRHRVFGNGFWVWVCGPDYYAYGDDCWWLRGQAYATGSPYSWSRYNACVGYY